MRRLLSWSWLIVPVAVAYVIVLVAIFHAAGESPSSTPPAPTTAPSPSVVKPGPTISHNAVEPSYFRLGDIRAKVVPVSMDGISLIPPSDPKVLGWWGRMAGSKHGVTLLVGHTVHTGGGALDHLGDVPVGSVAVVSGVHYRVVSNKPISKSNLAVLSPKIFHQDGKHELVVVTCTDYNATTGEYASNEVLVATPLT